MAGHTKNGCTSRKEEEEVEEQRLMEGSLERALADQTRCSRTCSRRDSPCGAQKTCSVWQFLSVVLQVARSAYHMFALCFTCAMQISQR